MITDQLREYLDGAFWSGDEVEDDREIVFSFGAGLDSTALLIEFIKRGIRPDHIIFADTGGERPDIYAHIERMQKWLKQYDLKITIVKNNKETLEEDCIRRNTLPSLALGFHTCSQKYKIRPIAQYLRKHKITKIIKIIGYDAMEFDRAARSLKSIREGKNTEEYNIDFKIWFPLIEYGLQRKDLEKIVKDSGFCPAKSSCFYCPAMSRGEVFKLRDMYPELLERALKMEDYAKLNNTKGLGRSWNWRELIEADENQLNLWDMKETGVSTCGCVNW